MTANLNKILTENASFSLESTRMNSLKNINVMNVPILQKHLETLEILKMQISFLHCYISYGYKNTKHFFQSGIKLLLEKGKE